jgi:hypothetical protein
MINQYFPKGVRSEQNLLQGLVTESIQILGHDVYYLPRKLQKLDLVLGEDVLSKFDVAVHLEMYMENPGGEQDLLTKFGIQVKENITYVVSKERWNSAVQIPHGADMLNSLRPQEGDLIYEPITASLYEITYVDKENPYYQLNGWYQYRMSCELYNYSHEEITTGIEEIDGIETEFSRDQLSFELLKEDGGKLLQENGDSLIVETEPAAVTPDFDKASHIENAADYISWSADNPFGEIER